MSAHCSVYLLGTDEAFCVALSADEANRRVAAAADAGLHAEFLTLPVVSWWTEEDLLASLDDETAYSVVDGFVRVDQIAAIIPVGPKTAREIAEALARG